MFSDVIQEKAEEKDSLRSSGIEISLGLTVRNDITVQENSYENIVKHLLCNTIFLFVTFTIANSDAYHITSLKGLLK